MSPEDPLKILIVEDLPSDAELAVLELRKGGLRFEHMRVDTRDEFIKALNEFRPDIIISDYMMPSYNGMLALIDAREFDPSMPFILCTGSMNEETAVECIKAGANDYVIKEHLTRLPFAVIEALEQHTILIEKRAAELLLKENEEKLQSIFRAAPVGIGLVVDRIFIEVNDTFCRMTGYNRSELIGKDVETIYSKDEQNESAGIVIYRHIAEKGTGSVETRFKCKDGRILNIFLSSTPLDKDDLTKGVTFIAMDITERKKAEETLIIERKRLRTLIDNLPDMIYVKDSDLRKVTANRADLDNIGLETEDEALGKTDLELFPGPTGERGYADDIEVIKTGKAILGREEDFVNIKGERRWLLTSKIPLHNKDGKITGLVGIGHDITDRKRTEAELLQSYVFSESLLKTIPFAMDIVDETGTILYQSDIFKILFEKEGIGEKCWDLYRDDKKQCSDCPLFKGITIGETAAYESHGVLGNRIFDISHTGMMFRGKKAMLEIFQDITERKENEQKLIRAMEKAKESDRLKSAFLTNMSHEIRTPMNGIIGFTELLKEPLLTVEEQQDFIQTIQISGARMLNTINSIVDMSKIESGLISVDINETNLNEKIEFTYKFFKQEVESKGLKFIFKTSLTAKAANIKTDNEKVYGILTNLVRNAIKFTYEGLIEFGYVLKSDSEPGSTEQSRGAELEFFVKDTGVGMPENQKGIIFERFRQGSESHNRGYEGSGLGLSICKSYVEMLGGKIWVESEEGKGSIFYFTIPYNPVSEQTSAIENVVFTENKEVQIKKLKILIVEDDEISYSLLTRTLQRISKEILHAITGVQAVEACRNNPDLDLVLMDIRMPRMNGLEATQQIRQFNKDVIIIAQTAYGFSDDFEKALEAGCNDFIAKPINKTLLYELIKKHCNK